MRKKHLFSILIMSMVGGYTNGQNCNDLFISEYIDGVSKNKSIEIFNASDQPIALNNYAIQIFNNGAPTPLNIPLVGTLNSYEVYVVSHNLADAAILAETDQTDNNLNFDGNDAIVLVKGQSTYMDKIGEIGVNPGVNGWAVPPGTTKDHTLIRKPVVQKGQPDWAIGATEWDTHPQPHTTDLGQHGNGCAVVATPEVQFNTTTSAYEEIDLGTQYYEIRIDINEAPQSDVYVDVFDGSNLCPKTQTATLGSDYALWTASVVFTQGNTSSKFVEFSLNEDGIPEPDEYICFTLISGDAIIGEKNNHQVTILQNNAYGIHNYEKVNAFEITPSLADDRIELDWSKTGLIGNTLNISIFDLSSREVFSKELEYKNKEVIDVSQLHSGVHNIIIADRYGNIGSSKFIKK